MIVLDAKEKTSMLLRYRQAIEHLRRAADPGLVAAATPMIELELDRIRVWLLELEGAS